MKNFAVRSCRIYLVLMVDGQQKIPKALTGSEEEAKQVSTMERRLICSFCSFISQHVAFVCF